MKLELDVNKFDYKAGCGDMVIDSDGDAFIIVYDNEKDSYRLLSVSSGNAVWTFSNDTIEGLLKEYEADYSKFVRIIKANNLVLSVK